MNSMRLLLAEIVFRPLNFLLCLLAVAVAATLFVAGPLLLDGYMRQTQGQLDLMQKETETTLAALDKETKRIMRDIGVNLRIVHRDTNFGDLYTDYKAVDFEEDDVHQLAKTPGINTIVHLVATINKKIIWKDRPTLLVGMLPVLTVSQKNEEKPHMVKDVKPGTVHVGHHLGAGLTEGEDLEIMGRSFKIASIEPSRGDLQDMQLVVQLDDAQEMLDMDGRIHQILALSCKCKGDRLSTIQGQLETALPHVKVTEMDARATAREKERDLVSAKRSEQLTLVKSNRQQSEDSLRQLVSVVSPLVVVVCGLFIALLTWINVRERRCEIGVLRALGRGVVGIAGMILGKAALVGLLGGSLGCVLGIFGARLVGDSAFQIEAVRSLDGTMIAATVLGAPLVAVAASYLPMLAALMQDPARVLSSE